MIITKFNRVTCLIKTQVKNCILSNVISLWETLEVEQARKAVFANQVYS